MLQFLIILVSVCLYFLVKTISDPLSRNILRMTILLWATILLISSFNPYDLKPVSIDVYLIMLLYVSSFVLGALLVKAPRRSNSFSCINSTRFDIDILKVAQDKKFLLLYIVCLLGALYLFKKQQLIIVSYNLGYLREDFYNLMFSGEPLLAALYNYILAPFFYVLIVIETYLILYNRKWRLIILFFPFIILYGSIAGGRIRFMAVIIVALFMLLLHSNLAIDKKVFKKTIKVSVLLAVIFAFVISVMSMFRAGETEMSSESLLVGLNKFTEQIVVYSVGSLRAFDIALQNDYVGQLGGFQFGSATFCGIGKFLEPFFRHLFGIQMELSYDNIIANFLQTEVVDVGRNHYEEFNFAYTSALIHYLDLGCVGVFLIQLFFGYFSRSIFIYLQRNLNVPTVVIGSVIFYTIIYSVFTFFLINGYGVEVLILMFIWNKFFK